MKIELKSIPIRDLVSGYTNDPNNGVYGYHGKLNIRPPYQREFRYDLKQQQAVIETILKGFPLNIMYWSIADGETYEMIDGQQRTLSICEFYQHGFNIVEKERPVIYFDTLTDDEKTRFLDYELTSPVIYFDTLTDDEKTRFLDYELTVYFCDGTDKEKLDWFRVINIAGERLLEQELRNAVYVGSFVTDARRYFSKNKCAAYQMASDYMTGKLEEQAYLQTVLLWAARHDGISDSAPIDKYMALHQYDANANLLWAYFMQVITWVKTTFPHYRKEMKGLDWGGMFDEFGSGIYDVDKLEKQIHDLMEDDEIMKKSGIYRYVLSGDLHDLNFRTFDKKQKREAYERQKGICPICGEHFELEQMEADHIIPWCDGGITVAENCQMLCRDCNRRKGGK